MSMGDQGGHSGETYFVDRQRMRDDILAVIIAGMLGQGGGALAAWTFLGSVVFGGQWTSGSAWMRIILGSVVAAIAVRYLFTRIETTVRPDGLFQRRKAPFGGWWFGDTAVDPSEITGCHVVQNGNIGGQLAHDSLPDRTRKLLDAKDFTGVYVETTGDPPEFFGIFRGTHTAGGGGGPGISSIPGFLITDRPDELADAIERARGAR